MTSFQKICRLHSPFAFSNLLKAANDNIRISLIKSLYFALEIIKGNKTGRALAHSRNYDLREDV